MACYAMLFNQINPVMEENKRLKAQMICELDDMVEKVALAMLNRNRKDDGDPLVTTFYGFDEESIHYWINNAKAAIAAMGDQYSVSELMNKLFAARKVELTKNADGEEQGRLQK